MKEIIGYVYKPDDIKEAQATVKFVVAGEPFAKLTEIEVEKLYDFRGMPLNLERLSIMEAGHPILLKEKENGYAVHVLSCSETAYKVETINAVTMDGTVITWEGNQYRLPLRQEYDGYSFGVSYVGLSSYLANLQPLKSSGMEPAVGVYKGKVVALTAKVVTKDEIAKRLGNPLVRQLTAGFNWQEAKPVNAF